MNVSLQNRTSTDDRARWLEDRKQQIGASEVAAILGISTWSTPWEVWAAKTGRLEPWSGSKSTDLGKLFERAVLDHAEIELGQLERDIRLVHDSLPLAATLDARTTAGGIPIEAKTTGLAGPVYGTWGEPLTDQVPDYYLCQVHAQLLVTGAELAYLFAVIGGRGVVKYQVSRNDRVLEIIGNRIADWWDKHITRGIEPDKEAMPSLEVVKRLRKTPDKFIELGPEVAEMVDHRVALKADEKRAAKTLKEIDAGILLALGDAEGGSLPDGRQITHFEQSRRGFTVEPTSFRVLRIKGK